MTAPVLADPRDLLLTDPRALQDPRAGLIDPDRISQQTWAELPKDNEYKDLASIAVGVGAAYYIIMKLAGKDVTRRPTALNYGTDIAGDVLKYNVTRATAKYRNAFTYMLNPAIQHAFRLGAVNNLSPEEERVFATQFSHQVFDYINDSSAKALVDAYQGQLAQKWHPDVAWARIAPAYGLDNRSMSQYVKMLTKGEGNEILPTVARGFVERALQERAKRIGTNEAQRAMEMGKTLVWMSQYSKGHLPADTQRRWLTAEDERVCPICGPMDRVQVPMMSKFKLPDGNEVWAPGIHPNCRCSVELTYPELLAVKKRVSDFDPEEHPRNRRGEFTRVAERAEPVVAPVVPQVSPQVTPQVAQVAPVVAQASPQVAQVTPQVTQVEPVVATVQSIKIPAQVTPQVAQRQDLSVPFLRPERPLYIFANDLNQSIAPGSKSGFTNTWAGEADYQVGDVINLDRYSQKDENNAPVGIQVDAVHSNQDLAWEASEKYGDIDAWDFWDRNEQQIHHDVAGQFYGQVLDNTHGNFDRIIERLNYQDVRSIYEMSNREASLRSGKGMVELKDDLKNNIEKHGYMVQPFLHYIETQHPTWVPGGQELMTRNANLPIEPHTPTVIVFRGGAQGGYLEPDRSRALIHGSYEITGSEIIPSKLAFGTDAPSNIAALRVLFVEPVGVGNSKR